VCFKKLNGMVDMTMKNVFLFWGVVSLFLSNGAYASQVDRDQEQIDYAVSVVNGLCLRGTALEVSADVEGNVTLQHYMPGAVASVSDNIRETYGSMEAIGATLRTIGDVRVRECMSIHLGRIINAVFELNPPVATQQFSGGESIEGALKLGIVPGTIRKSARVTGKEGLRYFSFELVAPAEVVVYLEQTSRCLSWQLLTEGGSILEEEDGCPARRNQLPAFLGSGRDQLETYLVPGRYYISVAAEEAQEASSYQMTILATAVSSSD
jgi:hypothetical protein